MRTSPNKLVNPLTKTRLVFSALVLVLALSFLTACTPSTPSEVEEEEVGNSQSESEEEAGLTGELQVFAAASLMGAFDELTALFAEQNPGVEVAPPVYDGSSVLAVQIDEGAPANVFASADLANMDKVVDTGLTVGEPELFASNVITIAVAPGNPKGVTGLEDLANPDLALVLCEDEVPCGAVSKRVFDAAQISVAPVSKEQNVTSVSTKVASGEADAGLIYVTDVKASDGSLEAVEIEGAEEFANLYPIVPVENGGDLEVAEAFIELVLSEAGQAVLEKFGFSPAQP